MDTEVAFLAAMAADSDNNLPRLVFADWLEENGDANRAEFIRLQCEASTEDAATARADELLTANRQAWEPPIAFFGREIGFHRGFPHSLRADFERIVKQQALLGLAPDWHLHPTREDWDFDPQVALCERFVSGPFLDRVRGLNLAWAGWLHEELEALFVPPLIGRLRELRFGDDDYAMATLGVLLAAPELRLETLGFGGDSYGGIGDVGCQLLADDPRFATLTALELPNNELSETGIRALATSPHLMNLRELDLSGGSNSTNEIGPDGAGAIANSTNFRHLATLNLAFNNIEDDGFSELVRSPNLPELRRLNAPGNGISNQGLIALAESDAVPNLNWLNLCGMGGSGITHVGIRALASSPRMERLTGLKLSDARLGEAGAAALADSPGCRNLTELYLSACGIGFAGWKRLLESPHLSGVKKFDLRGTKFNKAQKAELAADHGDRLEW